MKNSTTPIKSSNNTNILKTQTSLEKGITQTSTLVSID